MTEQLSISLLDLLRASLSMTHKIRNGANEPTVNELKSLSERKPPRLLLNSLQLRRSRCQMSRMASTHHPLRRATFATGIPT